MSLPDEEARALGVPTGPLRIVDRCRGDAGDLGERRHRWHHRLGWPGGAAHRPHAGRAGFRASCIPAAALLGGGFLLVIDTLARTMAPIEIPLGILTALVGTPFFIWLLASVSKTWS